MARKEIKTYVVTDDLSGEEIPEDEAVNIEFSYAGRNYSIDLGKRNAEKFDSLIQPYLDAATQVRGNSRPSSKPSAPARPVGPVRDWAAKNGYELNPKGRIPKVVLDAYDAAH